MKMKLFNRKKSASSAPFPIDKYEPVLKSSICTGELTACFRDRETGKLHDIMVIRQPKDLHDFGKEYSVDVEHMRTIY